MKDKILRFLADYQVYTGNFNTIQQFVKAPIMVAMGAILISDELLLRWDVTVPADPIVLGLVLFVINVFFNWYGGKHPLVKRFREFMERGHRKHNDPQMEELIRKVDELHGDRFS